MDDRLTQAVDYEAELAVVIGRPARRVDEAHALDHVAGYTCFNDVSARDLQYADRQFTRSQVARPFCPMGPGTGHCRRGGRSTGAARQVPGQRGEAPGLDDGGHGLLGRALVAFCSRAFTLEPGDVIATGTPAGVGWFREPKRMLADGDEVVVEIERVGRLVNRLPCSRRLTAPNPVRRWQVWKRRIGR